MRVLSSICRTLGWLQVAVHDSRPERSRASRFSEIHLRRVYVFELKPSAFVAPGPVRLTSALRINKSLD